MKTFRDLIKLGETDPAVHDFLTLWEIGELPKEDMLVNLAITLAEQKRGITENYIKHIQNCTTPPMIHKL